MSVTAMKDKDDAVRKQEDAIIKQALQILEGRMKRDVLTVFNSPQITKDYLRLKLGQLEHEVFGVIMLDTRHRFIKDEVLFRGTIDGAGIFPREVVKTCLLSGPVSAVLIYHNHPSGLVSPSDADKRITERLKESLGIVDVQVLDHLIISYSGSFSFAEEGLI